MTAVTLTCPLCGDNNRTSVEDCRSKKSPLIARGDDVVWRRRECLSCGQRFTTFEITEASLVGHERDAVRKLVKRMMEAINDPLS